MLYLPRGADPPLGRVGSHERGDRDRGISGTRGGAGRRAGSAGWSVVIDARDDTALQDDGRAHPDRGGARSAGGRHRRRHHRGRSPPRPHRGRLRAGWARPRSSTTPARWGPRHYLSLSDYPLGELRVAFEVNVVAPLGLDPGRPPAAARRDPPASAQHHLRRRGRGLRGLGRLRRRQGGARAARRGPGGRVAPRSRCGRSTPATCAPPCTRRPSRARTSPTVPSRPASYPPSSTSSAASGRAAATGPPSSSPERGAPA